MLGLAVKYQFLLYFKERDLMTKQVLGKENVNTMGEGILTNILVSKGLANAFQIKYDWKVEYGTGK